MHKYIRLNLDRRHCELDIIDYIRILYYSYGLKPAQRPLTSDCGEEAQVCVICRHKHNTISFPAHYLQKHGQEPLTSHNTVGTPLAM